MHRPAPRRLSPAAACALIALAAGTTAPAFAGDLTIVTNGLRSDRGEVLVAVCTEATFTKETCAIRGRAAAGRPVLLADVPPGRYAVQAIHDENGDGDLNRRFFLPMEGIGFSRDAPMRRGPPRFEEAAVTVGADSEQLVLTMRYFQ